MNFRKYLSHAAKGTIVLALTVSSHAAVAPKANSIALSPQAQNALKFLHTLDHIPLAKWRMHSGDLPHGEAVDLDDSSWPAVNIPQSLSTDTVWLRTTVVLPRDLHGYDYTGATVNFLINLNASGSVPIIVYYNGNRIAMGEQLEPIRLFEHAKPGETITIAVKALQTPRVKRFYGATASISYTSLKRPDPEMLYAEATSAQYLVPTLESQKDHAQEVMDGALRSVDVAALQKGDQSAFDQSLRNADQQMQALRPLLQPYQYSLIGNSHIDAAWLWPWTESVDTVRRTFSTSLQLMQEYPNYKFTQSAAAYSSWMEEKYPLLFADIQRRVREGRWEIVGGMWVEPDLNMPDGESQVRQILIGKSYFKKAFGVDVRVGWNPDSFGYNWQLPQIYKKSGIDYFVTQKMSWNDTNKLPLKLFWWQSPDGSRVLTYFPHGYNNGISAENLAKDFNIARQLNPGLPDMMHLYGVGDHGGGPTRAILDAGDLLAQKDGVFPKSTYELAQDYFSAVEPKLATAQAPVWNYETLAAGKNRLPQPPAGEISLPVWNDELYLEFHRGVYTTQAKQKRNMRESEEWMLDAEKWSSLAWLAGQPYPADQLNEAWKKVLFNQFHDLAAGSGTATIYKDAQHDYDEVRSICDEAGRRALATLTAGIDTTPAKPGGVPVLVTNSLGWDRTDVVEATVQLPEPAQRLGLLDAHGDPVLVQNLDGDNTSGLAHVLFLAKDVPSLGYKKFTAIGEHSSATANSAQTSDLLASGTTLENKFMRVVVDPRTGCITSIVLKASNTEMLAKDACGNQLQTFKDTPKEYDAWNIDPGTLDTFTPITALDSITLTARGPVQASLRIVRHWQHSSFVQTLVLYAGLPRLDIVNDIDWHEKHVLLKAAFPLAATSPTATYEIPYGTIQRPTTRSNSWDAARFEVPALRWADLGNTKQGVSLLNDSKYGYDAIGDTLRLTLLRSPTYPDPNADQGPHHFVYSIYPHTGDWKQSLTIRQGYGLNYKMTARQVFIHAGDLPPEHSFVTIEPENLVLTALKKSETDGALILRFYEWAGKSGTATIKLPAGIESAREVNLMESPQGAPLPVDRNTVTVKYSAYGITTVRIRYANGGPK